MDISVNIYVIDLKLSLCVLKVLLEGSMSQILYLGPGFNSMAKNG